MALLYANRAMAATPRRFNHRALVIVIAGEELSKITPTEGVGFIHAKCGNSFVLAGNGPFRAYASYVVPGNLMVAQLMFNGLLMSDMTSHTFWKELITGFHTLGETVDSVVFTAGSRDVRLDQCIK